MVPARAFTALSRLRSVGVRSVVGGLPATSLGYPVPARRSPGLVGLRLPVAVLTPHSLRRIGRAGSGGRPALVLVLVLPALVAVRCAWPRVVRLAIVSVGL